MSLPNHIFSLRFALLLSFIAALWFGSSAFGPHFGVEEAPPVVELVLFFLYSFGVFAVVVGVANRLGALFVAIFFLATDLECIRSYSGFGVLLQDWRS